MSGLHAEQFATSREGVIAECRTRGLHLASVPFFFGPNKAKIKQTLTVADSAKMKAIASVFLARCPGAGEKLGAQPGAYSRTAGFAVRR